MELIKTT